MKKNQISKRRLGRTNLFVTELGFGAMDTPQVSEGKDALLLAFNRGINFVDTSRIYDGSEILLGTILPLFIREKLIVATKTINRTRDGAQYDVDKSLSLMNLEYIDLYQLDDVGLDQWDLVLEEAGALQGLKIAKYRGLIKYIGISSHDLNVIKLAIESTYFDTIMIEYSAFYTESYDLIKLAKENDIGVIIMRPLGGSGRMTNLRSIMERDPTFQKITPDKLLEFVLSNPDIAVSIVGSRYPNRVHSNIDNVLELEYLEPDEITKYMCEAAKLYDLL